MQCADVLDTQRHRRRASGGFSHPQQLALLACQQALADVVLPPLCVIVIPRCVRAVCSVRSTCLIQQLHQESQVNRPHSFLIATVCTPASWS